MDFEFTAVEWENDEMLFITDKIKGILANLDNEIDKALDNPAYMESLVYQHQEIEKALRILQKSGFSIENNPIERDMEQAEIQGEIFREKEMLQDC